MLILLFVLHCFQYASLYLATYQESATRHISLAETLRRLPLSFFGNRDLSDLTSTMIADCSALDQMFSHYIPQLFASILSTLLIGVCMLCWNWKMALAALWVLPVAVLMVMGSKKLQDVADTRSLLAKRTVTEAIQEDIEAIRDIKSCNRQEVCLKELDAPLADSERSAIRSELATGVFVCSAQAFLHLGLATTVLVGASLLSRGELPFLYLLGFLFAAARLLTALEKVQRNSECSRRWIFRRCWNLATTVSSLSAIRKGHFRRACPVRLKLVGIGGIKSCYQQKENSKSL